MCEVTSEIQTSSGVREFLVRQPPTDFSKGERLDGDMMPKYVRTRRVLARSLKISERTVVSFLCTCTTFFHKLITCRHVFAIINREPTQVDLFPECHKAYEIFYGEDGEEEYTSWVNERTEMLEGIGGMC